MSAVKQKCGKFVIGRCNNEFKSEGNCLRCTQRNKACENAHYRLQFGVRTLRGTHAPLWVGYAIHRNCRCVRASQNQPVTRLADRLLKTISRMATWKWILVRCWRRRARCRKMCLRHLRRASLDFHDADHEHPPNLGDTIAWVFLASASPLDASHLMSEADFSSRKSVQSECSRSFVAGIIGVMSGLSRVALMASAFTS